MLVTPLVQNDIKLAGEKINAICDQICHTTNRSEISSLEKRLPRLERQSLELLRKSWKIIRRDINIQLDRKNRLHT